MVITKFRFVSLLLLLTSVVRAEVAPVDRIIAVVENDVIMESEARERLVMVRQQMAQRNAPLPPEHVLTQQVLERLIIEKLQLQLAERAGIKVDDAMLNKALANVAQQNNMSVDQFRQALERQGISFNTVRDQIKDELIINQVRQKYVNSRIDITESELENFMNSETGKLQTSDDYRLGLIFLPFSKEATDEEVSEKEKIAKEAYERLKKGANFTQTAVALSRGDTALKGGDLGWRKLAQFPDPFPEIIGKLEVGEITQPIRTKMGIHIFKLVEKKSSDAVQLVPQTRVRHILLKPNEIRDEAETKKLINKLRKRILAGESFSKLAKNFSDDKGSKQNGGEMEWVNPGQLVPEFEQVMNKLPINEVSKPLKTQYGWHIMEVLERREKDMTDAIRKGQANLYLRQQKFEEELQNWLQELREEAYVEIKI